MINIEGITVLAAIPPNAVHPFILLLITTIAGCSIVAATFLYLKDKTNLACILLTIFGLLILFGASLVEDTSSKTRYYVTISDSVSFKEIYNKYKIMSQNEELYVLEEKDLKE